MLTVLGKLKDTQHIILNDETNVFDRTVDWSPKKNEEWLRRAVERGDSFLLLGKASGYYATELRQLVELLTDG